MKYLTVEQAAEILQVAEETVRVWLRNGKLQGYKAGRFWRISESDIPTFLRQQKDGLDKH